MPKIQTSTGENLDSTYSIDTVDGVFGLILDSWGPKDRNPDYAKAMEHILSKLIGSDVPFINVYVVSRNLAKAYPNIKDRAISINGSSKISLIEQYPHELRLAIGREVGYLKEKPEVGSTGGNRFKRILIHNPLLSESDWVSAASSNGNIASYEPTADIAQLDRVVANLRGRKLENPLGSVHPRQSSVTTSGFLRDPLVKAWVLNNSNGICEACSQPAPFVREDGSPYLEVHHLIPLSEGGEDTTRNALAVCPNCHRRLHHGSDKSTLVTKLRQSIKRLNHGHGS